MLSATLVGSNAVAAKLNRVPAMITARLERVTLRFCLDLSARVKARKLSGQVLNVQTGRLRRSIHHEVMVSGSRIVGAVGTNVSYARIHEFGGTVQRSAHNRLIRSAWGRPLRYPVWQSVRAHSARFPERSFLRSALTEMRSDYRTRVDAAVKQLSAGR
jgi:phage gpG-like protein